MKAYAAQLPEAFVVVEATGGYEAALLAALLEQEVTVHRADPTDTPPFYCARSAGDSRPIISMRMA